MTAGMALRELQQAQAGLRKAREALRLVRGGDPGPEDRQAAFRAGWQSLAATHRLLAAIPPEAATDPVLTKQLAVQRSATALLVRLRRLTRAETSDDDDDDSQEEA